MKLKEAISFVRLMFKRRSVKELIAKNLELIYGYPLYAFSFLMPRSRRKWLVGSHIGFAGNPKYFFIEVNANQSKDVECIWIAGTRKEKEYVCALGLPVYYRWSWKGIYHCLTASVYIFGFHLIDVNYWTSGRVKRVNLWHGVGIKNIEFKSTKGSAKKIYNERNILSKLFFPYLFKRPHLFLSTSPLMTEHFKQCFRITDKECLESIYPRCDVLLWEKDQIERFLHKYESEESFILKEQLERCRKSYLYMPTWRETRADFITSAGFDFEKLDTILKQKNDLFLMKLHPESNLSIEHIKEYSNILIVDKHIDIYPILPFTDVLITDYSSIYYDYLLIKNKQVLLFPFDYSEYITAGRDFAFDFDEYTPGKRAYCFEDLLQYIVEDISLEFKEREWITKQFWDYKYSIVDFYKKIETLI